MAAMMTWNYNCFKIIWPIRMSDRKRVIVREKSGLIDRKNIQIRNNIREIRDDERDSNQLR